MRIILVLLAICCVAALGGQWIAPVPFEIAAARGTNGIDTVHKFGRNPSVSDEEVTIWQATAQNGPDRAYTNQTGAYSLWISAGSVANNGIAITVQGLDDQWDYQSVDVVLGTPATDFVAVGDPGAWMRVFRAYNTSSSSLTGIVYLSKDNTDAGGDGIPDDAANNLITVLTADYDQTMHSAYTIPDGKVGVVTQFCLTNTNVGNNDEVLFKLWATTPQGSVPRVQDEKGLGPQQSGCFPFNPPLRFPARTDLEVTGISTANANQDASASFDMYLFNE